MIVDPNQGVGLNAKGAFSQSNLAGNAVHEPHDAAPIQRIYLPGSCCFGPLHPHLRPKQSSTARRGTWGLFNRCSLCPVHRKHSQKVRCLIGRLRCCDFLGGHLPFAVAVMPRYLYVLSGTLHLGIAQVRLILRSDTAITATH